MKNSILNITNGDYFNQYFIKNFGKKAVPFCEAMMDGNTVNDIFSKKFIDLRCKELKVKKEEYLLKMYAYNALNSNTFSCIYLWFGMDTFCQMNLLTLLAYLEQKNFSGKVLLNYIDDETFKVIKEDIVVNLGIYKSIYEKVLILKEKPCHLGVLNEDAVNLYFDYLSPDGFLANTIKENSHKSKNQIMEILMYNSKVYGLSDLQAEKLISLYKK